MRGYPKHLNTRADVEYVFKHYPEQAKTEVAGMLDNRMVWQTTGTAEGDGIIAADKRVIEEKDKNGSAVKLQQELVEDPCCNLVRLGLSVADAQKMVEAVKTEIAAAKEIQK